MLTRINKPLHDFDRGGVPFLVGIQTTLGGNSPQEWEGFINPWSRLGYSSG